MQFFTMKFLAVFSLVALASGINANILEELEGQFILSATAMAEEFIAPLNTVQKDLQEIYGRTKSNFKAKGFSTVSPDDCLALSNTTQVAYDLALNATGFAVATVKEVTSSLNEIINCPSTSWLPDRVIKCTFDKLKIVQQEVLKAEADFVPYRTQAAQLYSKMIAEIRACAGY